MRKNRGITLIALVVTIIVLLVLAGVSINMLTGQNGILTNATKAKESSNVASDLEYLQTKAYEALTNYYAIGNKEGETEYILKNLNGSGVVADEKTGTVTYNGKTYDISDIIGKTSEQQAIASQTEVKIKQITKSSATGDDAALFETGKIRMIIEEEENNINRAVIPNGFYYVTGAPSTGLVVSDKFGDDDENTKGGNQFVWVPCKDEAGSTYEGDKGLAKTWQKYSGYSWEYTKYEDWEDEGNSESVNTYGGFYIARYEAGVPTNATFYVNSDGGAYSQNKNPSTEQTITENETNLTTEQLAKKLIPVSKKNTQCWNEITQENAVRVSNAMYYNNNYVESRLVDSFAWDTVVEWMAKDTNKYPNIATNSIDYGNYNNNYKIDLSNVFYAAHRYGWKTTNNEEKYWSFATKYSKGQFNSGAESVDSTSGPKKYEFAKETYIDGYEYDIKKELATGASNVTKVKNIYDMAGNMWEWTTEVGNHNKTATKFAVLRGGSFRVNGSGSPVSYRSGGDSASSDYDFNIGFRVVLYIK